MNGSVRAAAVAAVLVLAVNGCSSGGATPSAAPPSATPSPTPILTNAPTSTATPTVQPTASGGQYLLYESDGTLSGDQVQPQAWLTKADGSGKRMVVQGAVYGPLDAPQFVVGAEWSQNGTVVHVQRYPDQCVPHLSDLPIAGGPEVARATLTNSDHNVMWSPDDSKIIYQHMLHDVICQQDYTSNESDLIVMNADGSAKRTILKKVTYEVWDWLPDGSSLVVSDDNSAWFLASLVDGSTAPLGITSEYAAVSPDGKQIAYLSDGGDLMVRGLHGGTSKDLGPAQDFTWSPDSSKVALVGDEVDVISVGTGTGPTVYPDIAYGATWSPDGKKLAFIADGGGIVVVPAAGGAAVAVPGTDGATYVLWQP